MDDTWTKLLFKLNMCLAGIYFGMDAIFWLYKWCSSRPKEKEINEALFTSDFFCSECGGKRNTSCKNLYCYNYTIKTMESFLNGAQRSVYVCMNVFTSHDLGLAVLRAHKRGVAVKIIANRSTAWASGSQIKKLHAKGITVRLQKTQNYVHHKFCLIDSDTTQTKQNLSLPKGARTIPSNGLVLTGSMNWTFQAMDTNSENVMITSDKFLVREFHQEFLQIWNHNDIDKFK